MQSQSEKLTIKVLRSDKLALQQIARAEGETLAVIVRKMLRESLTQRRGLLPAERSNAPTIRAESEVHRESAHA